jgi:GNAT superfamily N-acetyltransferase
MEAVSRLNLEKLKPEDREDLELFTEPQFRCCFDGIEPFEISQAQIVAIGSPQVGLVLAGIYKDLQMVMVYSIVAKDNQEEQLAVLFEALENELQREGGGIAIFRFHDDGKRTIPLWNVLRKREWSEPEIFIIKYFLDYKFNPPWLKKPKQFPRGFEKFPWKELTSEERANLLSRLKEGEIPSSISPFGVSEKDIEHMNSFGLRHNGRVIGWVVTNRVAPDTIGYLSFFIEPEYQHTGYSMRLLADAIEINKASNVTHAMFTINMDQSSVKWINFIEKRLAPYAVDTAKIYQSRKRL